MSPSLRIGIVGAGTAGSAAAILLCGAGHQVTVLECVAVPRPIGAGITLQPTGQIALERLGLREAVAARGAVIERLICRRRGGKVLVDLPYGDVDPELQGIGIHRGVLFETLFAAAKAAGATIHCGVKIVRSERMGKSRLLLDEAGTKHGPFDLVVVADGAACELHSEAASVKTTPYPWGALWLVVDDMGFTEQRTLHQTVDRASHMLGFLPTGMAPGRDVPVVSMFWSLRADRLDAWRAAGLPKWRDEVLSLDPRAEPILDTLDDLEPVLFSRYRDVVMYPWHGDRIVFLGDAAHAMSPQLGQGANLALVDAVVLADAVAAHTDDIPRALATYTAGRKRHLAFYQFATRALTPMFQSDSRVLAWMRDRIFPHSTWFHYLRRRMVRTMVGADRGLVRAPFALTRALGSGLGV